MTIYIHLYIYQPKSTCLTGKWVRKHIFAPQPSLPAAPLQPLRRMAWSSNDNNNRSLCSQRLPHVQFALPLYCDKSSKVSWPQGSTGLPRCPPSLATRHHRWRKRQPSISQINQIKSNQIKSNQIKSNQIKSINQSINQSCATIHVLHEDENFRSADLPFLYNSICSTFLSWSALTDALQESLVSVRVTSRSCCQALGNTPQQQPQDLHGEWKIPCFSSMKHRECSWKHGKNRNLHPSTCGKSRWSHSAAWNVSRGCRAPFVPCRSFTHGQDFTSSDLARTLIRIFSPMSFEALQVANYETWWRKTSGTCYLFQGFQLLLKQTTRSAYQETNSKSVPFQCSNHFTSQSSHFDWCSKLPPPEQLVVLVDLPSSPAPGSFVEKHSAPTHPAASYPSAGLRMEGTNKVSYIENM